MLPPTRLYCGILFLMTLVGSLFWPAFSWSQSPDVTRGISGVTPGKSDSTLNDGPTVELKTALLAGGCFWSVEHDFQRLPGVVDVISGYTGGRSKNPTYENYHSGGHREAVLVTYDASRLTYTGLVEFLLKHVDPTDPRGSFVDRGKQYATAIYFENAEEKNAAEKVLTEIERRKVFKKKLTVPVLERSVFWPAEMYHQDYSRRNLVAYNNYRAHCGRDEFIQSHWGVHSEQLQFPGSIPEQSGSETVENDSNRKQEAKDANRPWENFQKPDRATLRKHLSKLQFRVTQSDETEPAFRNEYWNHHEVGIFVDVVSGEPLFASIAKFDSGTGWPSFAWPIEPAYIVYREDLTGGEARIEVRSKHADSHLGHVFSDGPLEMGGKRYCMNSASLRFIPLEAMEREGYGVYTKMFKQKR